MTRPPRRVLLGTETGIADRCRVYRTAEALEVDLIDHYNIQRRRVFFDEVQLVTLHSRRGMWRTALGLALLALAAGLMGTSVWNHPLWQKIFLGATLVLAALTVVSASTPTWIVTVFGKRTRARMNFSFRSGRAHRVYAEMCLAAATAQTAAPQEQPELLPMPPTPPEPNSPP